jgi:hypothetical protein
MMIVSLTRGDLRHEFAMADEAFALSPISARAAMPGEEDYDAISHAFMETSRGRWFLGEFAKRNRNADTRMVLDAVARIEQSVASQRQQGSDTRLAEVLAAIRRSVYEAQVAAAAALDGLAVEQSLAPVRKGARIIKEISWRWREIGADARICDLLDSQVGAIDEACGKVASVDPRAELSAAFDLIKQRIAGFDDSDAAAPPAVEDTAPAPAAGAHATPAAVETAPETSAANHSEAAMQMSAEAAPTVEAGVMAVEVRADAPEAAAEARDPEPEAADPSADTDDAFDDALLDAIALEMAAPQPEDIEDMLQAGGEELRAAAPPAPVSSARTSEPIVVASEQPAIQPLLQQPLLQQPLLQQPLLQQPLLQQPPFHQPPLQHSRQPSLGSSLIAHGIVRKPGAMPTDPLAPIRRMSQAEKIAFFS